MDNLGIYNFEVDEHTPDQTLNEGQTLTLECRVKTDPLMEMMIGRPADGVACLMVQRAYMNTKRFKIV